MIDHRDMSKTNGIPSTHHANKPPKKAPTGNKAYVSSKVVDALVQMKRHTEDLSVKRYNHKERL